VFDRLALAERLAEERHLAVGRDQLGEPRDRQLDRRFQLLGAQRLHQVRHRPREPRPLDHRALAPCRVAARGLYWITERGVATRRRIFICSRSSIVGTRGAIWVFQYSLW
jgi:hypothetical protein